MPGLEYTFYGRKYAKARVHGMNVESGVHDFPRARNSAGGDLYRRHLGSADAWAIVEAALASDEHGHWGSEAHEISDTDATRTLLICHFELS